MTEEHSSFFFLGIGGIGMSALAGYLLEQGHCIYGYDRRPSAITDKLVRLGAEISFSSTPDLDLPPATRVVYTPAIQPTDPWFIYASEVDPHLQKRSSFLREISRGMRCWAVAGTHGKTTTSAMLTHLLMELEQAPTAFLGGLLKGIDSNFVSGSEELLVVEADEYDRSFLQLDPQAAIITSVEADHLDIYGDEAAYFTAFQAFRKKVNGPCLVESSLPLDGIRYGIDTGDHRTEGLRAKGQAYRFQWVGPGFRQEVELRYPGRHNVLNALAAAAICFEHGYSPEAIAQALKRFPGVHRRFEERVHKEKHVFYDDYAHHPGELKVLIESLREWHPNKHMTLVFQPHLYSRTRDHLHGFAEVLAQADRVLLLPIYPARETPIEGVDSSLLLQAIHHDNKQLTTLEQLPEVLEGERPQLLVTAGAGDIDSVVPELQKRVERW